MVARDKLIKVLLVNGICFQGAVERTVDLLNLGLNLYSGVNFITRTLDNRTLVSQLLLSMRLDEVRMRKKVDNLLFGLHFQLIPYFWCYH